MTDDPAGRVFDLASSLHPLHTPNDQLPVSGYRPAGSRWRPRPAAVLIPVLFEPRPAVILTVRSRQLAHHAGQVAFPGGGRQDEESFPYATALRETREEIGIDQSSIDLLGLLDRFDTLTGYRVTPVVAAVRGQPRMVPCPNEVESIFSLPWTTVVDPASYRRHRVSHGSRQFELISMAHSHHLIWGATAAILRGLCQKLSP